MQGYSGRLAERNRLILIRRLLKHLFGISAIRNFVFRTRCYFCNILKLANRLGGTWKHFCGVEGFVGIEKGSRVRSLFVSILHFRRVGVFLANLHVEV